MYRVFPLHQFQYLRAGCVELRSDLQCGSEQRFFFVHLEAERLGRLEHHAARRTDIYRLEIAAVLAIRKVRKAHSFGFELDACLRVVVGHVERTVVHDTLAQCP